MSIGRLKVWQVHAAGTTLVIALATGAYLVQIGPALSRHEQAAAQTASLAEEQTKSRELERTLLNLKDRLNATEREAAGAQLKLEPASELNSRLARLTELVASHELRVDSVESGQTISSPRYTTITIRLTGQGTYRNCSAMLMHMHASMPDVTVVAIDMGSAAANTATSVTFALDLLWYTRAAEPPRKN